MSAVVYFAVIFLAVPAVFAWAESEPYEWESTDAV